MKKKIFYRFFAVTLVSVLLMFASGIVAVNLNTKNVVNERLKEETELAAVLMNEAWDIPHIRESCRQRTPFTVSTLPRACL